MQLENMIKVLEAVQEEMNQVNQALGEEPPSISELVDDVYRATKAVAEIAFVLRQYIIANGVQLSLLG